LGKGGGRASAPSRNRACSRGATGRGVPTTVKKSARRTHGGRRKMIFSPSEKAEQKGQKALTAYFRPKETKEGPNSVPVGGD